MNTTEYGEFGVTYYECKNSKEFFDNCTDLDWLVENGVRTDCDVHIIITYKDGSVFDSHNDSYIPKKKNVLSAVESAEYGYTFYNASPRIERDECGEEYYFCEVKGVA